MPTLGQSNASIYGDIQLPKLLSITGPQQSMSRASAGPTKGQLEFGADQQKQQTISSLASQYLSDPDNPDYNGFIQAVGTKYPDDAIDMGTKVEKWQQEVAKKDVEQSKANLAKLSQGALALQQVAEQPGLYTPDFRASAVKAFGPIADKVLPATDDPDAPTKVLGVLKALQSQQDYLKGRAETSQLFADGKKVEGALGRLAISANPQMWDAATKEVKAMGMGSLLQGISSPEEAKTALAAYQAQQPQKAGESAKLGSFEDYVTRTYGANPTPANILAARKAYGQADDKAPTVRVSVAGGVGPKGGKSDVQETVAGWADGTLPPVISGRASKDYNALMAEAHRQKFDLAKANQDWTATQKYLGTLNGAQQTRLRQATEQVSETVPLVRALVTEWDSAGIPYLSAGNLAAAKKGAYGNKAQSIANRLDAQIADMTSELGTVYKGGNSSTDESLRLAARNLQGDWSKKAALDALDQIEQNIKYRRNSMKLGPVTDGGNRYAPDLGGPETAKPKADPLGIR